MYGFLEFQELLEHEVTELEEGKDYHSVHISGRHWKTFDTKSHAENVAKKIKGATVHKYDAERLQANAHAKSMARNAARGKHWDESVELELSQIDETLDVGPTYKKLAVKHLKDMMSKSATQANKTYAKTMHKRALEASKMSNHTDALNHYRGVKEEVELQEGAYEKSEENKRSADAAKKQGDMFAHHLHMADHHDNLAQWHDEKGRHGEANKHAEKAEQHHEKAMGFKEELELDEKISTAQMSHQGKTTIKHIDNPGVQLRMAAHDIKPGIKGFKDRYDLLKAAQAQGKLKESKE